MVYTYDDKSTLGGVAPPDNFRNGSGDVRGGAVGIYTNFVRIALGQSSMATLLSSEARYRRRRCRRSSAALFVWKRRAARSCMLQAQRGGSTLVEWALQQTWPIRLAGWIDGAAGKSSPISLRRPATVCLFVRQIHREIKLVSHTVLAATN